MTGSNRKSTGAAGVAVLRRATGAGQGHVAASEEGGISRPRVRIACAPSSLEAYEIVRSDRAAA